VSTAPPAETRIGLVGCGVIAYWAHLRALRRLRDARLVATADPDPNARERAKRLTHVPTYERAEELFGRNDIDAVVICAPSHLHAQLAVAAARAGKHFYLEKPLATNATEAREVLDAATEARVIGVVGFNRRRHPLYEQARRLLQRGVIGAVRNVQTAFCERIPVDHMPEWKRRRATGGGVLLDLASHHVDLLRWFLADEVTEVRASLQSEDSEDDSAQLECTMGGGIRIQSFFSFGAGQADFLEFIGERGTLRVDRHSPILSLKVPRRFGYGVRRRWIAPDAAVAAWRFHRLIRPSADPSYRRSLETFVAVLQGQGGPCPTLVDGMRSLDVVLGAEQSRGTEEPILLRSEPYRAPCASC
jgi:predicted dehydrogenase